MGTATLLLPERERFGAQRLALDIGKWLARGDRSQREGDQLTRVFDVLPRGWPVAAASRQRDAGDAAHSAWLRADPVYVRVEINGARLLAHGDALQLSEEDSREFLPPLKPLFGDVGFPIDAPVPSRWYLRLPSGAKLPTFTSPADGLGADLFEHLPEGVDGRRWRALLSEAQVVLHNHPRNAHRIERGLPPVNSLWFWGAGSLPTHVSSPYRHIHSDDEAVAAFAALANAHVESMPARWQSNGGEHVFDLRHLRDLALLQNDWLKPLASAQRAGQVEQVTLDFADGARFEMTAKQRWRFWRKPLGSFTA